MAWGKTNSYTELVTHYDIGQANNDVCQGNLPFGNPIKQHITKFHNVILLPFYFTIVS